MLYIRCVICKATFMADITVAQRDLPDTQQRPGQWFEQALGEQVTLSELEAANRYESDVACDTQVIVVRSSDALADLRCGGAPMVTLEASRSATLPASG
jgi:hypothetical protein